MEIKGKTQSLRWLNDLLAFFTADQIKIPSDYREQVIQTKDLLGSDTSGMVSTMLDFAIDCALVKYRIETENENFTEILNSWLDSINSDLRGKVPTKLKALAREYFRERWKGSSNLLLRTFWTEKDGFILPTTMFFVDGEDIIIEGNEDKTAPRKLGEEKYFLRLTSNNTKDSKGTMPLPNPRNDNEIIFAQRPYESWSALKTTPYLIRRGLFRNMSFFNLLSSKSEFIIGRAIEYLFVMKKGSEKLALDTSRPDFVYSDEDLKTAKTDLARLIRDSKSEKGAPTYTTNFDTEMEHLIPDYTKAISEAMYTPIERRLLAGLGLIDIIQGTASTRREALLNPKPFIAEIEQGIDDFVAMLDDIVETIKEKNIEEHRKYVNVKVEINHTPISQFIDRYIKQMLRSIYDRGGLSKKTLVEVVGELDYELEVNRRDYETKEGHDEKMKAPIIQNTGGQEPSKEQDIDPDKTGPEGENFLMSIGFKPEETKNYIRFRQRSPKDFQQKTFRIITLSESKGIKAVIGRLKGRTTTTVQSYLFQKSKWTVTKARGWIKEHKGYVEDLIYSFVDNLELEYEDAPYRTNKDLPPAVKNLPSGAKSIWRKAFNSAYPKYGEDSARKIAWHAVKQSYKKSGDKWVRKSKGATDKDETLIMACLEVNEIEETENE